MTDGDQLAATFPGSTVLVGNSATALAAAIAGQGVFNTTAAGDVTAYTAIRGSPASQRAVRHRQLRARRHDNFAHLELWFHPQPQGVAENLTVAVKSPSVQVLRASRNRSSSRLLTG